jgi:hypothetical protein
VTRCLFCDTPARDWHHPTGRLDGRYLDLRFTVGLCRSCHLDDHRLARHAGLDEPAPAAILRLRRLIWLAARLGDLDRPSTLPAPFFAGLAGSLRAVLDDEVWA